jgi:hypothetical protein
MTMNRLLILVLITFTLVVSARAADCPLPAACQPGDTVKVTSGSLDKANSIFTVTLGPSKGTGVTVNTPVKVDDPDPKVLAFVIPLDAPDGTYSVQIKKKPRTEQASTTPPASPPIDDLAPSQIMVQRPTITAVSPKAAFLGKEGKTNVVAVLGGGFRENSGFHNTKLNFTKLPTPMECPTSPPQAKCYELAVNNDRQITLTFYSLDPQQGYYSGPMDFVITVDGVDSNSATLALINSNQDMPMTVAFAGLALILVIVYLLIMSGRAALKQTFGSGKTYLLSALFLDVQTETYSLSKCQFYAWTAASVLGYIFLAVSRSYVQGSATFPDIPSGLPGILLASAGTAVLSTGIASAKGDKGAGDPGPNLSDFIASGGVVAADRLQFVVWTVIGIGTFLAIVFNSDPRSISDLPAIPPGFLQLMGISAGGYIAGKLVRKAGPSLDAIAVSGNLGVPGTVDKLTFQLTGSAMSQSALFSISGEQIFPDTIRGKDGSTTLPEIVQVDPTVGDPTFARILRFYVENPPQRWVGANNFTITNPDAQKAMKPYQVFKVDDIKITAANNTLTITGDCFDDKLKVQYTPPGGPAADAASPTVEAKRYTATVAGLQLGQNVTVTVADNAGVKISKTVTAG